LRWLAATLAVVASAGNAAADPLRLRADALSTSASPAGLLVLESDGEATPWLSAEAVVWLAAEREPEAEVDGDVLVVAVRWRAPDGWTTGQVGRFVASMGALRPVHVDGGAVRVRLPASFDVEAMAGMPVPSLGDADRSWDWLVGGRVSRRLGDFGSVGVGYAQRRDDGQLASEELGIDLGFALGERHDLAARAAYDLAGEGLAEVGVSASRRQGPVRLELYGRHREASHLLPATSLFSVIGDVPSQRGGLVVTWRAAPRLDLVADVAARRLEDDLGEELSLRARLRLDAAGRSLLGAELRRAGGDADVSWTGVRGLARVRLIDPLTLSTELELVVPDEDRGRGRVWPWGLAALAWQHGPWQAALAVEASASPEDVYRVDGLLHVARQWGLP
jgi:hypothetical protein